MMTIFLILLLLSSVLCIGPPGMLHWESQLFMLSLGIMLFYLILQVKDNYKGTGAIIGIFGLWAIIRTPSPMTLFPLFLFLLIYFTLIKLITPQHIPKILNVICIMAIVQVGYVCLQMSGHEPLLSNTITNKPEPVGFMGNANMLGAFLAFCVPAFLRKRWVYALPIVLTPLILLPHTKGAVISLMVGVMFWLYNQNWSWRKKIWLTLLPLYLLGFILSRTPLETLANNDRYQEYRKIFQASNYTVVDNRYAYISDYPNIAGSAFGYGWGSFKHLYPLVRIGKWGVDNNEVYDKAHNEYLEVKFNLGWIGLIPVAFFLWAIYRYKGNLIIKTALTAIVVNCLINFPLQVPPVAMLIITYMAMMEATNV